MASKIMDSLKSIVDGTPPPLTTMSGLKPSPPIVPPGAPITAVPGAPPTSYNPL